MRILRAISGNPGPNSPTCQPWLLLSGTDPFTATVLLVFGLASLLLFIASCAHTMQGLSREQALYRAGTNIVGEVQSMAPYLPAPVGSTVEICLALATSALGAWNLHQQATLRQLKNGNGNGKTAMPRPQLAAAPPPTPAQPAGA